MHARDREFAYRLHRLYAKRIIRQTAENVSERGAMIDGDVIRASFDLAMKMVAVSRQWAEDRLSEPHGTDDDRGPADPQAAERET